MNKYLYILFIIALASIAGLLIFTNRAKTKMPEDLSKSTVKEEKKELQPKVIEELQIIIDDFKYNPKEIIVKPGELIKVVNKDSIAHNLVSDSAGLFSTGLLSKEQSDVIHAPKVEGIYPYHCSIHPTMTGVIIVKSSN